MSIERYTYQLQHYTLTAPTVDNEGRPAPHYPEAIRRALLARNISGWTETATSGYWRGRREPGIVFTLYLPALPASASSMLARIGRESMPDQSAIQITYHGTITLWEA